MVHKAHLNLILLFSIAKLRDLKVDLRTFPPPANPLTPSPRTPPCPAESLPAEQNSLKLLPPHLLAFSKDSFYGCTELMPPDFSCQSLLNGVALPF